MKLFLRILGVLAFLLIAFSLFIATKPGNFDVKRTKEMKVPISVAYKTIDQLKTWETWGPWKAEDPSIVATYPEQTSGVGGSYSWTSKQGAGSIKTLAQEENKSINQLLSFENRDDSNVYWTFKEVDNKTEVTWGMKGDLGFMGKVFFTMMGGADKILGKMLEDGLTNIDNFTQDEINKYSITKNGIVEYNGGYYVYLTTECSFDEMGAKMDKMLPDVLLYTMGKGYPRAGSIFTLYHKYDEKNKRVEFSTCIPVKERVNPDGEVALAYMENGRYYKTTLKGAYKYSEEAWKKAFENAKEDGVKIDDNGKPFEVYAKGHTFSANPADWITEIYLSVE
jgi:effector-binding domain-containing protein